MGRIATLALLALLMACGGGSADAPAPPTAPVATPSPSPAATVPAPTPTPTPTATPTPYGIDATPLVQGEPRPLPADVALFYQVLSCTACAGGFGDIRRIIFDEATGELREDRPLAFFDDANAAGWPPVEGFQVSASGQAMAALICTLGRCGSGIVAPDAYAEQRIWVSWDAGRTWEDRGPVLTGAEIVAVTTSDVLVLEQLPPDWRHRLRWLVSGEMVTLPAGGDPSTWWYTYWGWRDGRPLWAPGYSEGALIVRAEVDALPVLALGGLDWELAGVRPDGAIAWFADAPEGPLLAIADERGTVRNVFGPASTASGLWIRYGAFSGSLASKDVLIFEVLAHDGDGREFSEAGFIDLATGSIHALPDLALPWEVVTDRDGLQRNFYRLLYARPRPSPIATVPAPTPTAAPTPHGIDGTPLVQGEPRPLPPGIALFHRTYPCWQCGASLRDFRRTVHDAATGDYREDRPLAFFDGAGRGTSLAVSPGGRGMAAAICHAGQCELADPLVGDGFPTADADLRVWVSRDAGRTWADLGGVLPVSSVVAVTDDDVLILEESTWRDWGGMSAEEWAEMIARLAPRGANDPEGWEYRFRWLRSGETFAVPPIGAAAIPQWRGYGYAGWMDGRPLLARASSRLGLPLWETTVPDIPPPTLDGLDWGFAGVRPDGLLAWDAMAEGEYRLALTDERGAVRRVYGSAALGALPVSPAQGGQPVNAESAFATNDLFFLGFMTDSEPRSARLVLLDLATLTFHPVRDLIYPTGIDADGDGRAEPYYQFFLALPHPVD